MVLSIMSCVVCWAPAIPLAALNMTAAGLFGFVSILVSPDLVDILTFNPAAPYIV